METRYERYALAQKVLVVAVITYYDKEYKKVGDWSAYIDTVQGTNHENEWLEVTRTGSKLSSTLAHAFFPQFNINRYRN